MLVPPSLPACTDAFRTTNGQIRRKGGGCLDAPVRQVGETVKLTRCDGSAGQRWQHGDDLTLRPVLADQDLCLEDTEQVALQLRPCDPTRLSQQFAADNGAPGAGAWLILRNHPNNCLDVTENDVLRYRVCQATSTDQRWLDNDGAWCSGEESECLCCVATALLAC